jgi:hypothetical protein
MVKVNGRNYPEKVKHGVRIYEKGKIKLETAALPERRRVLKKSTVNCYCIEN